MRGCGGRRYAKRGAGPGADATGGRGWDRNMSPAPGGRVRRAAPPRPEASEGAPRMASVAIVVGLMRRGSPDGAGSGGGGGIRAGLCATVRVSEPGRGLRCHAPCGRALQHGSLGVPFCNGAVSYTPFFPANTRTEARMNPPWWSRRAAVAIGAEKRGGAYGCMAGSGASRPLSFRRRGGRAGECRGACPFASFGPPGTRGRKKIFSVFFCPGGHM